MRDAPWIEETERTGYCSAKLGAWWNNPPEDYEIDEWEEDEDGDVYFGSETDSF